MKQSAQQRWFGLALVALMALMAAACAVVGGAQADSDALQSEIQALQQQLAAAAPTCLIPSPFISLHNSRLLLDSRAATRFFADFSANPSKSSRFSSVNA